LFNEAFICIKDRLDPYQEARISSREYGDRRANIIKRVSGLLDTYHVNGTGRSAECRQEVSYNKLNIHH